MKEESRNKSEFKLKHWKTVSKQTRVSHPLYSLLPTDVAGFASLAELALDMRWSWNHADDELWRQLVC